MTDPIAAPCYIHLIDGREFVVSDINAWCFDDHVVVAEGHFFRQGMNGDMHVLIPWANITYIRQDYAALDAYVAAQAAETEEPVADVV